MLKAWIFLPRCKTLRESINFIHVNAQESMFSSSCVYLRHQEWEWRIRRRRGEDERERRNIVIKLFHCLWVSYLSAWRVFVRACVCVCACVCETESKSACASLCVCVCFAPPSQYFLYPITCICFVYHRCSSSPPRGSSLGADIVYTNKPHARRRLLSTFLHFEEEGREEKVGMCSFWQVPSFLMEGGEIQ